LIIYHISLFVLRNAFKKG
jgi:hypothetical protein